MTPTAKALAAPSTVSSSQLAAFGGKMNEVEKNMLKAIQQLERVNKIN